MLAKSQQMSSIFDCKLTPQRTELLVAGYTRLSIPTYVTMDIIRLFTSYFNNILYWNRAHKTIEPMELQYIINKDFIFKITNKIPEKINIELQANWEILTKVVFRMRIFSVNDPYSAEFNQICHVNHTEHSFT